MDKWKTVLRCICAKREYLDALIDSGYVLMLDDGSVLISDWLIHNRIRRDRYTESRHNTQLDSVYVSETGRYFKA